MRQRCIKSTNECGRNVPLGVFNAIDMRLFEIDHSHAADICINAIMLKLRAVVVHIALAAFTHLTKSLHAV